MGAWSDSIIQQVLERISEEADLLGAEIVQDIQDHISHPVGRGPGGEVIERSAPGDDPWYERGQLHDSERYTVFTTPSAVELNIINDAWYAWALHEGHGNVEPRPFHDHALNRWRDEIPRRMYEAITGEMFSGVPSQLVAESQLVTA